MIGVLFLLILFFNWSGFTGCVNEEAVSLFAFKEAINEDPENALSNWNISDENPCSWNGISCKENRVISLSIPKKYLKGFVPSVLGSLSFLRHINLRNNKLHGTIPVELFQVQGLQSLVLYGNNMTGSLPLQIGKLRYLQILDLSGNLFNGSIPTSLLDCKRLKNLILSHNSFTDSLPHGFGSSFPILEKLDLSYNRLNGSIPSDLGNLSSIQETVDLSHNLFSGSIPASLGNLPEKIYIDLSYNNLSGPIPENGALGNRGPTAFMGNPLLCGPPLKNLCSQTSPVNSPPSSNIPFLPTNHPPPAAKIGIKHKGLSKIAVIAIIASDAVAIAVIGMAFLYCYCRAVSSHSKDETGGSRKGEDKWKKECLCLCKEESETFSENAEQFDLVPLDLQVGFDLDELLRASAFVLGKTGNGIVYKVVLEDGLTLAVRRLGEGGSQRFKEFQTEVEAIGKIRHPNIVTLRAYYWSIDEKLLIYDYIPNGNLVTAIHGKAGMNTFTPMPWCARLKIIKGIAKGLAYLHEFSPKKYVHGDLKPTNILLGSNMEPYISDFGLGRLTIIAGGSPTVQSARMAADSKQTQYSEISGSLISSSESCYQAPEALKVLKPSQKWDVYSYGVILLEMVSGKLPLVLLGTSEMDLVRWVQFCIEEKKPFADVLDPVLAQEQDSEGEIVAVLKIALACVQNNPDRRPTMKHVSYVLDRLTGNG